MNGNQYEYGDYKNTRTTAFGKYSERFEDRSDYGSSSKNKKFQVKKHLKFENPGPGSYELISDFGVYDMNKSVN